MKIYFLDQWKNYKRFALLDRYEEKKDKIIPIVIIVLLLIMVFVSFDFGGGDDERTYHRTSNVQRILG